MICINDIIINKQQLFPHIYFSIFLSIISIFYRMNKKRKNPTIEQTQLYDRITKIQTQIINRVTVLKNEKLIFECRHFDHLPPCQPYQPTTDYYQKFWKCFLLNELCHARLQKTDKKMSQIETEITQIERLFKEHQTLTEGKGVKRKRRQAIDIDKQYNCPYPRCYKSYGAEIALNLHIKQKHNGGNKTERQHAAEMICHAQEHRLPIPIIYINLPPGYLEEYAKSRRGEVEYGGRQEGQEIYEQRE